MKKSKIFSILSLIVIMITSLFISACGEVGVKEIQIDETTFKGVYEVGEEIDYSKIQVKAVLEDGSEKVYKLTDEGVEYTPIDTTSVGTKEFKITVQGSSIVLSVKVNPALSSIEIFNAKTMYALNEEVDYSSILLKAVYGDETENFIKLSQEGVTYNQIDTSTPGEKVFTVEYLGKTASLTLVVSAPSIKSLEIVSGLKAEYNVGETLNASEIKLKVVKDDADSTIEYVFLNSSEVAYSVDLTSQGEKIISITYGGLTITKTIKVVAVLQSIAFESNSITVDYKSAIDYSKIFINVIYNDANVNKKVALNDSDVTILEEVDTFELGTQTLKVEYQGKQATVEVVVAKTNAIKPLRFALPQSYIDYQEASMVKEENNPEEEFAIKGRKYVVGNVNKFKFIPVTQYVDPNLGMVDVDVPITTYELQIKGENNEYTTVDSSLYIDSVVYNMYKFNDSAVDKAFKLNIKLDEEVYDLSRWNNVSPVISIEFVVKKAYNAYDVYGLSVVDNLNVNNWAKIKDQKLIYDDKKLSEYTDVTLVVLHNDIAIDADKLPSNYFWSENMTGYETALSRAKAADNVGGYGFADKLKGSLRDGDGGDAYAHCNNYNDSQRFNKYKENGVDVDYNENWGCINMQKGIFNTDQCSISGNYMTISTKESEQRKLSTIICNDYTEGDILKMSNPITHWSMFKFFKTSRYDDEPLNINVENVFMQGNMKKENKEGIPAGLMAINTLIDELTLDNVITSQFYTHIVADGSESIAQSKLNFKNSRMFDAYSNMIYLWRSDVTVINSIMKNAGGPLFILCDAERKPTETDIAEPQIKIDEVSELESFAAGTEAWYKIFNATALFTHFKNWNGYLKGISGKSYVQKLNGAEQINLIAVVIPAPETIMSPRSNNDLIKIKGKVTRGDEEFNISDTVVEIIKTLGANGSTAFVSGGQYAFMPSETQVAPFAGLALQLPVNAFASYGIPDISQVPGDFAGSSSDWLGVTMSAAPLGVPNAPYFSVIIGDFNKVQA